MAEDRERASLAGFDGFVERADQRARKLPGQVEGVHEQAGGLMDIPVTALAVDDEPAHLKTPRRSPHARGYRVLTAPSGAEALALLEPRRRPSSLLDIVMPRHGRARGLPEDPATPATEFFRS